MKAVLVDAYRHDDNVILWLKTPEENIRIVKSSPVQIYLEHCRRAEDLLMKHEIDSRVVEKTTYIGEKKRVYEIVIHRISRFESIVKQIERETRHRVMLYNADISPEQMFLYRNRMNPFSLVEVGGSEVIPLKDEAAINLEKCQLYIMPSSDIRAGDAVPVRYIIIDGEKMTGSEESVLKRFAAKFTSKDPDVISIENAFSRLPYLVKRLRLYGIVCDFNRWDEKCINSKGGKTFFSYGRTMYREYAVRLNGRFLIDSNTTVGEECNVDGIMELSFLSGTRFQQIASRSFGAVFQSALIAEMVRRDYIVPFKEKPIDRPISLYHQLKFDRVGHTFDPKVGLHHDVAEIDFSSLFPWIIYNYNISTETLLRGDPPYQRVPGFPIKISLKKKGIVPTAIKPLLDRRMHYKKNPSSVNKDKILGLKWVLVTSYGYLRFREFKLGIASSHMAIGSFAREIMIKAKELCEDKGFRVIHGIVDSLYIQKKGVCEKEVRELCREMELETGVPISFDGIFKWIVFLPSVNDIKRPVPTRYYGIFDNGEIKARGMEVRQAGSPKIVKEFQMQALRIMSMCNGKEEIAEKFAYLMQVLRKFLFTLPTYDADLLSCFTRVSKVEYQNDIPQKEAISLLKKKGISVVAGQKVHYVFSNEGVVLPEDYTGKPDTERYKRLFVRSLFVLLQPFGFTKDEINKWASNNRQATLDEFAQQQVSPSKANPLLQSSPALIPDSVSSPEQGMV